MPATGTTGKIYVTLDTNKIYRWSGSVYVEITSSAGGGGTWGSIIGTLSNQTDLQSALDAKQNQLNGTGFVKASGTTITYDNSTYLTTSAAASTYVPYTGATGNVTLGEWGLTAGYLKFDLTPTGTPTGLGTMYWDAANRTVSLIDGDGDTTLQIGQEERVLVHNNTGSTLTDGQVVYITGSTGELPSVALASNTSEATSSVTLGVVTETIANGADGFITTSGVVHGLNTLGLTEGAALWLGTGGAFTQTKPVAPANSVLIGYVIKNSGGNGSIFVKIQNGSELEELHDVLITSVANNQGLFYESATGLWKNKTIAAVLGYTPYDASNPAGYTTNVGTVTSVAALTIDSAGSDITSSVTDSTTTPVITLSIPDASTIARGVVTNGTQTFGGSKTFSGNLSVINGSISVSGNTTLTTSTGNTTIAIATGATVSGATKTINIGTSGLSGSTTTITIGSTAGTNTVAARGTWTFAGNITAASIIKSGGTSSQFLKADGSVDSNTYLTSYTETDPIYTASSWYTTTNNASNWDTAYGWGNHASAGYLDTVTAAATYLTISSASSNYQPKDIDLTAIAGLADSSGLLFKAGDGVWSLTNNYQPLDADLTAIAGLSGTSGFLKKTAADTWSLDTSTYLTSITSSNVTTALGYTPVTNARTLTINGTAYDLTADRSWTISAGTTLNGTGFVKASGTTISYDNSTYVPTNGTGATGTWGISISGNAATATTSTTAGSATNAINLWGPGGSYIASQNAGTSYSNHIQIREAGLAGAQGSNGIYAPALAFHWSGVVASNIVMEASGRIVITNNPGTSYEAFAAAAITCTSLTETSSKRYKENINTLDYSISDILKLMPVCYNRIGETKKEIGFIAEDMELVIPEIIEYNYEGEIEGISYGRLTAVLVKAVKEQQKQIEELKSLLGK